VRSVDVLRWLRSNGHPVDSLMAVAPNVVDPTYARIHALILHMYEFQNRPTAGSSDCTGCARRPPVAGRTREGWDALSLSRDRFRGCLGREQVTPRRAALGVRLSQTVVDGLLRLGRPHTPRQHPTLRLPTGEASPGAPSLRPILPDWREPREGPTIPEVPALAPGPVSLHGAGSIPLSATPSSIALPRL
jgi:hypothetical protein